MQEAQVFNAYYIFPECTKKDVTMKHISFYLILIICMIILVFPSVSRTEENGGNAVQKGVQTIEKKTDQGVQKMESAAEKAAENIEVKKREAEARIKAAAKYGHEKAQKRVEWLKRKAAKLEAEAARIEARMEADIRRERDRIEKKALELKMKLECDKPKTEEKK
jgi:hypothetical protein